MAAENFLLPVNMMAMAVFMSACSVAAVLRRQPRESSGANSLYGRCWRKATIRQTADVHKMSRDARQTTRSDPDHALRHQKAIHAEASKLAARLLVLGHFLGKQRQ
jgi:hypothetical protein